MRAELYPDNTILVSLSRSNLKRLIYMLDHGIHTRYGLVRRDGDWSVIVLGQEDSDHYKAGSGRVEEPADEDV